MTFAALIFALALSPQAAPPADPATPPVAEAAAPAAGAAAPTEGLVPAGAPADDYGLVNWCHGALSGHMALYPRVRDQLPQDDQMLDEQMLAAGRDYLGLYDRALAAADQTDNAGRRLAGAQARQTGVNVWARAQNAEATALKWAFLGWSLPGRCETAANRLLGGNAIDAALAPALEPAAPQS